MDERLQKAIEFSNYRQTLNNQINALKIQSEAQLVYSINGGSFDISQSLLGFVSYLVSNNQESAVLLDKNNIPVRIDNLEKFLSDITTRYFEVTNYYLEKYEEVRKSRSVKKIINLEDE